MDKLFIALCLAISFNSVAFAQSWNNPFTNPVQGPSTYGYVLPSENLHSYQPNPYYQGSSNNNFDPQSPASNAEIYKRMRGGSGNYTSPSSNYVPYSPKPSYNVESSPAAPLSNVEIYKRRR